jgi:hypothetical protein
MTNEFFSTEKQNNIQWATDNNAQNLEFLINDINTNIDNQIVQDEIMITEYFNNEEPGNID